MRSAASKDILTKSLGQGTVFNRAKATFEALRSVRDPRVVASSRGKTVEEVLGRTVTDPYETGETTEPKKPVIHTADSEDE